MELQLWVILHLLRHVLRAGALELRNYPTALRSLETPALREKNAAQPHPKRLLDMAALDVWRGRESRLPLFNDYLKVRSQDRKHHARAMQFHVDIRMGMKVLILSTFISRGGARSNARRLRAQRLSLAQQLKLTCLPLQPSIGYTRRLCLLLLTTARCVARLQALSLPTYKSFDRLGIDDVDARNALKEVRCTAWSRVAYIVQSFTAHMVQADAQWL